MERFSVQFTHLTQHKFYYRAKNLSTTMDDCEMYQLSDNRLTKIE